MAYDCLVQMDESFNHNIAMVLAPGAVHECEVRADVIGADLPFLRIIGNMAKEDKDGIAGRQLECFAFNPSGPFVESTIGWSVVRSGRCVRLVMFKKWGGVILSSCN